MWIYRSIWALINTSMISNMGRGIFTWQFYASIIWTTSQNLSQNGGGISSTIEIIKNILKTISRHKLVQTNWEVTKNIDWGVTKYYDRFVPRLEVIIIKVWYSCLPSPHCDLSPSNACISMLYPYIYYYLI